MLMRIIGFIVGLFRISSRRRRIRQMRINVEMQNINSRNVNTYQSTAIESFVSRTGTDNAVASGGNPNIRNRISAQMSYNANRQGRAVVVLHCGNRNLENMFNTTFSGMPNYHVINSSNPIYDPFYNATKYEISQMVINSCGTTNNRVGANGAMYIDGLTDYLIARGQRTLTRRYIECPHDQIMNRINDAFNNGNITAEQHQSIIAQLQQGVSEQGAVNQYFRNLSLQASCVLVAPQHVNGAVNVKHCVNNNGVLVIDAVSATNRLLIGIIMQELRNMLSEGKSFTLVLDSIPLDSSETLKDLMVNYSGASNFILSTNDLYSEIHGTDTDFNTILGRANYLYVMRHNSPETNKKFSDTFGHYRKVELIEGFAAHGHHGHMTAILPSDGGGVNIAPQYVDRPRVEESELYSMGQDDVYIRTPNNGEIIFVRAQNGIPGAGQPQPSNRITTRPRTRAGINWLVFFLLLLFMPPAAFIYSFCVTGVFGKIVSVIFLALFIAYIVAAISLS